MNKKIQIKLIHNTALSPGEKSAIIRALADYALSIDDRPGESGILTEMAFKLRTRYPQFDNHDKDVIIYSHAYIYVTLI